MWSCLARRGMLALFLLPAAFGRTAAQSVAAPQPSALWVRPAMDSRPVHAGSMSPKERGLLIGATIGGLVSGVLGHAACRAYSSSDGCAGETVWWAVMGGMLGGLIGASGARGAEG